jgi:hypothetical protein
MPAINQHAIDIKEDLHLTSTRPRLLELPMLASGSELVLQAGA